MHSNVVGKRCKIQSHALHPFHVKRKKISFELAAPTQATGVNPLTSNNNAQRTKSTRSNAQLFQAHAKSHQPRAAWRIGATDL